MNARTPRVVVIGGGVIGCSVAWRMARRGVAVTLLERDEPGAHASSAAAGMLSPLKEADEPGPFLELGLRSLERYPEFVRDVESASGVTVDYRRDGRIDVAFDEESAEALRTQQRVQEEGGYDSRLLEAPELRRLEPTISPHAQLGLATELDHQVDPDRLMRALWIAAHREGVDVRTHSPAAAVETDPEGARVAGVRLVSGERIEADVAVVAAGPWSGQLGLPMPTPVEPVRGQIVVLQAVPPLIGRVVWGPGCYLVPRGDGRVLVGSTMEHVGFHAAVSAGAVQRLLEAGIRLVPGLGDAAIHGFRVGLRPGTPDGLPVIGPDPEVAGLVFATGHLRNGILLAPETGDHVAAIVLDAAASDPAFAPGRFTSREPSDESTPSAG